MCVYTYIKKGEMGDFDTMNMTSIYSIVKQVTKHTTLLGTQGLLQVETLVTIIP